MRGRQLQAGFTFLELLFVVAILGVGAAIAIPKFMSYMRAPDQTEALVQLEKLRGLVLQLYAKGARYPIGTAATLPTKSCCEFPEDTCPVTPQAAWFADPTWAALGFWVDEPHLFQYAYASDPDGQTFTATATGDLDCDGNKIVYTLAGSVVDGVPRFDIKKPLRAAE